MSNFASDQPHNDLPQLSAITSDVETRDILKLCIEARSALSELKQAGKLLPDQSVLINTLPLLEAQASSEIENIVTTRDELFKGAQSIWNPNSNPQTKEALRYRQALKNGFEKLRETPLATGTAVAICRTIKNAEIDIRSLPGTALASDKTGEIIYTPPEGAERIHGMLNDLFQFMHSRQDIDPLVRMSIGHYQFEAIHPFSDGNGRTGRVLNVLFLIDSGLIDLPTLYLSGYINTHRDDYYRLLLNTTQTGDWNSWITYMVTAVLESAKRSCQKIQAITKQIKLTQSFLAGRKPRLATKDLMELIFHQPYSRIQNLVEAGIAERQTASRYLHQLEKLGVLRSELVGRDKVFVNWAFLKLLLEDENNLTHHT